MVVAQQRVERSAESQQQALQAALDKVGTISAEETALDMRAFELGLPLRLANDLHIISGWKLDYCEPKESL